MADLRASHFQLGPARQSKYLDKFRHGSTFVTQNMLSYKWIEPVASVKLA